MLSKISKRKFYETCRNAAEEGVDTCYSFSGVIVSAKTGEIEVDQRLSLHAPCSHEDFEANFRYIPCSPGGSAQVDESDLGSGWVERYIRKVYNDYEDWLELQNHPYKI